MTAKEKAAEPAAGSLQRLSPNSAETKANPEGQEHRYVPLFLSFEHYAGQKNNPVDFYW